MWPGDIRMWVFVGSPRVLTTIAAETEGNDTLLREEQGWVQ